MSKQEIAIRFLEKHKSFLEVRYSIATVVHYDGMPYPFTTYAGVVHCYKSNGNDDVIGEFTISSMASEELCKPMSYLEDFVFEKGYFRRLVERLYDSENKKYRLFNPELYDRIWCLEDIIISPEYRGKGLMSLVLDDIQETLRFTEQDVFFGFSYPLQFCTDSREHPLARAKSKQGFMDSSAKLEQAYRDYGFEFYKDIKTKNKDLLISAMHDTEAGSHLFYMFNAK